jgi:hypothetical protein
MSEGFCATDRGGGMRQKGVAAIVYGATAIALALFFDGLYAEGPTRGLGLIHAATVGCVLFAVACLLSFFTLRSAVAGAITAGILSWPLFGPALRTTPWHRVFSIVRYSNWQDLLAAILTLAISSVYSIIQLRSLLRGRNAAGRS